MEDCLIGPKPHVQYSVVHVCNVSDIKRFQSTVWHVHVHVVYVSLHVQSVHV